MTRLAGWNVTYKVSVDDTIRREVIPREKKYIYMEQKVLRLKLNWKFNDIIICTSLIPRWTRSNQIFNSSESRYE